MHALTLILTLTCSLSTVFASSNDQVPLGNKHSPMADEKTQDNFSGPLMLSDILTLQNSASIFYDYARETKFSQRFERADERSTVLAPTNKAIMSLARKPHQDPAMVDDGIKITEEEFDARSKANVEHWVSAHIIPQSPITFSPTSQFETLQPGCVVTVSSAVPEKEYDMEKPSWKQVVLNGNVSIISRHEASNGVLYLVDGVICDGAP